ncbi:MAG: S-methyl-5-thioribose-1-phosphate isomerase, partial [Planctomycetota bacterium]
LAAREGLSIHVYADETRPLLQGARLTSWELARSGVSVTVICDSAAATVLTRGDVDAVFVGSDRIAGNGDVANKIGTLSVALAAHRARVPFYVVAPSSTFDLSLASGSLIPIEERAAEEVAMGFGPRTMPAGVPAHNPAFDVTPAELVTAIVTEKGLIRPVDAETVRSVVA